MSSEVRVPESPSTPRRRPETESFPPEVPTRLRSARRSFLSRLLAGTSLWILGGGAGTVRKAGATSPASDHDEGVFAYIARTKGRYDPALYRQLLGAANEFKEGDRAIGVAARDDRSRTRARALLANTRVGDLIAHPVFEDSVSSYIDTVVDREVTQTVAGWTLADLKRFLLEKEEAAIKGIMPGLPSDIIGCVVKLMSNEELIAVGRKVFNPLPHSNLGAKGYMGARIQPNSPTDNVDDIRWQVFDGWSYAVGDVVLGTNPVSSEVASVASIQSALAEILEVFGLEDALPHCVLSHVDVQAEVERQDPGSTAIWFQSLGGVADANRTFDLSVEKMVSHAERRTGKLGPGAPAPATNPLSLPGFQEMHPGRTAQGLRDSATLGDRGEKPVQGPQRLHDPFTGPHLGPGRGHRPQHHQSGFRNRGHGAGSGNGGRRHREDPVTDGVALPRRRAFKSAAGACEPRCRR